MTRVIVIGSVNHDRIWKLDAPLISGGRLRFSERTVELGGGAFHTGCQLLELGAEVVLVSRLMADERGLWALNALMQIGFDMSRTPTHAGETVLTEILLEPNGERTIIGSSGARPPVQAGDGGLAGDAAYLNVIGLEQSLVKQLDGIPLVVSQLPLRSSTPRPADYIISSRADVGDDDLQAVWRRAIDTAGQRLKMLVLTDGPRPITLYDGVQSIRVDCDDAVEGVSFIGAGDRFGGAFLMALLDGRQAAAAAAEASRQVAGWLRRQQYAVI
jgi:sugar/nucleoside kinase (ribokinase family)